jgi:hypothetical protein
LLPEDARKDKRLSAEALKAFIFMVPEARLELARAEARRILSSKTEKLGSSIFLTC